MLLTTVKATVRDGSGVLITGTITISWGSFTAADGTFILGGQKTISITAGLLVVALIPNTGSTPSGTSYQVRYYQSASVISDEIWLVPTSSPVATPGAPTSVTQAGTPGAATYYYWVSAVNANGETLLGPSTVTTTSHATLDGTNYNIISWAAVSGATSYRVWRTTTNVAPTGTGLKLVGSTAGTTLNDQSNTLTSATVPSVNDTDPKDLDDVRVLAAPSPSVIFAATQVSGVAVVKDPAAEQVIIAPNSASITPLAIKGRTGNSAKIFTLYDNAGTPILQWYVGADGVPVWVGDTAKAIAMARHATADTAGNALTVTAGGATSGATNKAGGGLVLQPGLGTGSAVPALARIQQDVLGTAAGTSDHSRVDRLITGITKVLVNNTATALINATLADNTVVAGIIRYTVEVFNGTDLQVEEGVIVYHATNKGGVIANNTTVKSGNQQAMTAGTLTVTWTITAANPAVVTINANSSLTPSSGYPRVTLSLENLAQQAVAVV